MWQPGQARRWDNESASAPTGGKIFLVIWTQQACKSQQQFYTCFSFFQDFPATLTYSDYSDILAGTQSCMRCICRASGPVVTQSRNHIAAENGALRARGDGPFQVMCSNQSIDKQVFGFGHPIADTNRASSPSRRKTCSILKQPR